jgi:hypothetical protein
VVSLSPNNYVYCIGDALANNANGNPTVPTGSTAAAVISAVGSRMPFFWYHRRNFSSFPDGTSNTAAVSECLTPATYGGTRIRENVAVTPANGAYGSLILNSPAGCTSRMSAYVASKSFTDESNGYGTYVKARGLAFTDGSLGSNMFSTLSPPNSPMCAWGGGRYLSNMQLPPASNHPGGVTLGLFDGSVRFVSNAIRCGDQNAPSVTSGASPYGVWGALGSPDGGESVDF